jgi:hypothetical protein
MVKPELPQFEIVLQVKPQQDDPTGERRLRAFLKAALRRWGLRCLAVRKVAKP